ncbi:MAG TPA: excalibur calcium-binding domain-containing protein [Marmoricola sp.]|nr:excalibur calcium-binding domain-containing protein [Marmoricola sp.]
MSGQRRIAGFLGALAVLWMISQAGHSSDQPASHSSRTAASPSGTPTATPAPTRTRTPARASTTPKPAPSPGSALQALAALPVKGRAPMIGYTREEFGQAWLDADRNGCDTRNDVLRRDVSGAVLDPRTHGCVVLTGILPDPYLGREVAFHRGPGDQVDIDHVVALGNAWVTGAFRFDIRTRAALANDPLNLLAVDASSNRSKGDGDAATWLPPYKPFRCAYVARQIAVKAKYGLWVTAPERAAMTRVLAACPGQALPPDRTHAPTRVDQQISDPATASPRPLTGGSVYYANCDAVRAAGKAPIHVGDPGYSRRLDRDGDGVGCE